MSKVTSSALGAARAEQMKREAAVAVAAAEKRLDAFAPVSKVVARLREVTALLQKLDADVADHTARRDRTEAEVRAETDTPFAQALAELPSAHTGATARLTAELRSATAHHAEKEAALARAKEHLAEVARKPGFFGRLFGGKPKPGTPDPADIEKQAHALEAEVGARAAHIAELQKQADAAATALAAERDARIATEVASRRAECEAARTAAESDCARARAEGAAAQQSHRRGRAR